MRPKDEDIIVTGSSTPKDGILSDPEKNAEVTEEPTPMATEAPYYVFTKG